MRNTSRSSRVVTVLLPCVKHSACLCRERVRNIRALNGTASVAFRFPEEIGTRCRVEQDQEYENIKCSKINFLGRGFRCDRIFGAG